MKYLGLNIVGFMFYILGVLIGIGGICFSIIIITQSQQVSSILPSWVSSGGIVVGIAGIIGSLISGLIIYSIGDFCFCVMNIERNTRK